MIRLAIVFLLFVTPIVFADEHHLDLGLSNKTLSEYVYSPPRTGIDKKRFFYKGIRSYYVYYPSTTRKTMPVLVALHGAGRSGASMVDTWRAIAKKYSFIVVAPNAKNNRWDFRMDESDFIYAAVKKALSERGLNSSELYLFGHSNGAKQAIAQAARHPAMFKGVAAHAGTLPPKPSSTGKFGKGVKIGLFLGDSDHIFSVQSARQTISWLSSMGATAKLYILKDHTHWYYHDAYQINDYIWRYLSKVNNSEGRLPQW